MAYVGDRRVSRRTGRRTSRYGQGGLRHFYASIMLADGASIIELAEYLGHHDPAVTLRIYGHLQPNSHHKGRKIIDARMFPSAGCLRRASRASRVITEHVRNAVPDQDHPVPLEQGPCLAC